MSAMGTCSQYDELADQLAESNRSPMQVVVRESGDVHLYSRLSRIVRTAVAETRRVEGSHVTDRVVYVGSGERVPTYLRFKKALYVQRGLADATENRIHLGISLNGGGPFNPNGDCC